MSLRAHEAAQNQLSSLARSNQMLKQERDFKAIHAYANFE
jgi:hypothetical protein